MKMTFTTVVAGGLLVFLAVAMALVFIPVFVWSPPQTFEAHPYTPLQEKGRVIYYSNGCDYCHTLYVRPFDNGSNAPVGGTMSQGGNYVFDDPGDILGSERTGPDLGYIGRKRAEAWEIEHWKNPRKLSPLSLMPSFEFLSDDDLKALAAFIFNLGDRTSAQQMIEAPLTYAGQADPKTPPRVTPNPDGAPQGWPMWIAAGLQEGKELFVERCFTCHGCAGNGLGEYAGTAIVTPADFKVQPFKTMPPDQWFWHISEGVQGSLMPTWKVSLTEDQRWNVINYLQQEFANPVSRDPDEGDPPPPYANMNNPLPLTVETLEEGKAIYTRECWVCHGDAGSAEGVYREGLMPIPANFSNLADYADFTDADYFWRISEGVPWSSMPAWKIRYGEEDRWKLVHFLRVNFTQTEKRPPTAGTQDFLDVALTQKMPERGSTLTEVQTGNLPQVDARAASFEMGKGMYLQMCARCHGLTGDGKGWAGGYLDVQPANFHDETVRGLSDGDWFARVTYGIQNSAMPVWGEWMPMRNRWDAIKFIEEGFVAGVPGQANAAQPVMIPSVQNDAVPVTYRLMTLGTWFEAGNAVHVDHGMQQYGVYCATCHNDKGQGMGPGIGPGMTGPAAFPTNMSDSYVYWRTAEGVEKTVMPPFNKLFDPQDIWDLTAYVQSITGSPMNVATPPGPTPLPALATPAATPTPAP